jgi:hypothetical protein
MVRLPWGALNDKRMDLALQTWLLRPTSIPSSLWYLSSFRGEVYVRAKGPMEARWLAAEKLCKYPKGNMTAAPLSSPLQRNSRTLRHSGATGVNQVDLMRVGGPSCSFKRQEGIDIFYQQFPVLRRRANGRPVASLSANSSATMEAATQSRSLICL